MARQGWARRGEVGQGTAGAARWCKAWWSVAMHGRPGKAQHSLASPGSAGAAWRC